MDGGKIYNNSSNNLGGAFYIKTGTSTFNSGEIYQNNATDGGAITATDNSNVYLNGTLIYENTCSEYGAGLYVLENASVEMNGGRIFQNQSAKSGAGVFITGASTFVLNDGEVSSNTAQSGNGGGFINKSTLTINGGKVSDNSSPSKGGAIHAYDGAKTTINGGLIEQNTSNYGGGVSVYDLATLSVLGGVIENNTATGGRGNDIYGGADTSSDFSTIVCTNGKIGDIGVQYSLLQVGGMVNITGTVEFHASKKDSYACMEIISELDNPILVKARTFSEESSSSTKLIMYNADDPYSNIYRSASKIKFTEENYYAKVEDGFVLMSTGQYSITVNDGELALSLPNRANDQENVTFSVLEGYVISNLQIQTASGENIEIQESGSDYSFIMPAKDVIVSYDYSYKSYPLSVDENIKGLIDVNSSYNFKEKVSLTLKDSREKKLTALSVLNDDYEIEIDLDELSFYMFQGATIVGETSDYHNISIQDNDLLENVEINSEKANLGYLGENVTLTISLTDNVRYGISKVYYQTNGIKTEADKISNNQYQFVMPDSDVEIIVEVSDILADISDQVSVAYDEQSFIDAFSSGKKYIALQEDITLTQTISLPEGDYTIISLGDHKICRGQELKGNMFEVSTNTILNLGEDGLSTGLLSIDGNKENVNGVYGSAIFVERSGQLNIYEQTIIENNSLNTANYNYTQFGKGNNNAGGSALYNYNGVINMYGGEIQNNSTSNCNGGAIYNFGRFNLYGGLITNNSSSANGGAVYNIRIFNQDGGDIEYNSTTGSGYGGGIYNANSYYCYYYLISGKVSHNVSERSGAGIFNNTLAVTWIKGGEISFNSTSANGGAINNKGTLFVIDGVISNNYADSKFPKFKIHFLRNIIT